MGNFRDVVEKLGLMVDGAGVLIVIVGLVIATVRFIASRRAKTEDGYRRYRQDLGRAILLGLEFLVAGGLPG